ncbi:MAG: ATP-dependent zinc metalloprotease FtsH [Eubacteriales bacterium]|nr:ATP-dependent zinc metalloprotease FtsH [Eubacteriales bacterium]
MNKKVMTTVIWVALFVAIFYMISGLNPTQTKPDELDYNSKFLQLVRNTENADTTQKTIKAILVDDRTVYGLYADSTSEMSDLPKKAEFLTVLPSESTFRSDMAAIVFAANPVAFSSVDEVSSADYGFAYESVVKEESIWTLLLPSLLFIGAIVAFYFFMMRAQGGGKQMQNFGKSRARMTIGDKLNITFADVAGADEEKEELKEIVDFMRAPERFNAIGARIPKGVLLVGPPGTGKTLLAKAVAGEAQVPFFSISGSDFVEMFVGVGASRVRDLFQTAKRATPAVVFIDEIDAVGRHRGAGMGGGHDEREQTLNQLLVEMDGFAPNEGIIVIAATNRPDILDPALLRPGRFDRQITVSYPDVKGREEILKVHARNKPMGKEVSLATLAKRTPGFTGADLANVLNEAAILAARANLKTIGMTELEEAITRVQMGPEKRSRVITEADKRITAYHESGHAIIALKLAGCDPVHEVSIVPRGMAAGYTMSLPKEDMIHVTKNKLLDNIAMMLGGRVAELLKFHDVSTGAYSDLKRSSEVAKKMVTEYGMSDSIGPMFLGGREEVFIAKDWGHQRNYSESLAATVDEEIRSILETQFERARTIIKENLEALDRVSEMLIEYERVTGEEFAAVFNGESAVDILKKAVQKRKRKKPEVKMEEPVIAQAQGIPV